MEHQLKSISKAGIPEAIAKVELYRYLNEPEEAESICRDILAIDPDQQLARRMLGLSITDQFLGITGDRYEECRDRLAAFCELIKSPEHIHTYRLTPLSLWNARAAGMSYQEMIDVDRKSTRLNSSHSGESRMPSSA